MLHLLPFVIALMYSSDYGYATDFTKCTQNLYNYNNSANSYACRTNDWLYKKVDQWLLNQVYAHQEAALRVSSMGQLYYSDHVGVARGVRPVLFLNSETNIEAGNIGTSEDPYRISIN